MGAQKEMLVYNDFQAMFKISFHFFCLNFSHLSHKQIKSRIFRLSFFLFLEWSLVKQKPIQTHTKKKPVDTNQRVEC